MPDVHRHVGQGPEALVVKVQTALLAGVAELDSLHGVQVGTVVAVGQVLDVDREVVLQVIIVDVRDQCLAANVPFFFKQWGGVNKKKAGRLLDDRLWNQMPAIKIRTAEQWN